MLKSHLLHFFVLTLLFNFTSSCTQCTAPYDSAPMKKILAEEEKVARSVPAALSESGELPAVGGKKIDAAERYATLCASCHGAQGAGDGPGSAALNPKPRNFVDATWQKATTDDRMIKVIKNGGASVGLSPTMAPWGAVLSDEEITAVAGYIRTMSK